MAKQKTSSFRFSETTQEKLNILVKSLQEKFNKLDSTIPVKVTPTLVIETLINRAHGQLENSLDSDKLWY